MITNLWFNRLMLVEVGYSINVIDNLSLNHSLDVYIISSWLFIIKKVILLKESIALKSSILKINTW